MSRAASIVALCCLALTGCPSRSHTPAAAAPRILAPAVIDLWPEGVPGTISDAPTEHIEDGRVYNVNVPTLTVFPAPTAIANGTSVIVCPGGGYVRLAVSKEGSELTHWFNGLGITVFVLKYRIAPYRHPAELRDVLLTVRLVRSRSVELGVDPRRAGVFGSSAGGHLAASAGTLFESPEGKTGAELDAVSARPDFMALIYPVITMKDPYGHAGSRRALLGDTPSDDLTTGLSIELHVTSNTPPTFIAHTAEDKSVPVENSILLYQALRAAAVPVEMHLYEKGPHGFGLQAGLGPTSDWPKRWSWAMAFDGARKS